MEITLSRVIDAARQRRAAVTAEAAGYVVLLLVQRVAAWPSPVTAELVLLTAAGEVRIEPGPAASTRDVEVELRRLLATLLALSQSAPPALHAAGERGATGDLAALESELLAALIPLNHAAAGRALARLYRETLRAPRVATGDEASPVPSSVASPVPSSVASQPAPSPAVPVVRTPPPGMAASQRAPSPVVPAVRTLAELEIDVDLDVDGSSAAAAPPRPTLTPPQPASQVFEPVARPFEEEYSPSFAAASALPPQEELEPSAHRSDLRELLNGFLAHTRCEERMAADLRRMIGLGPGRGTSGHGSPLGR